MMSRHEEQERARKERMMLELEWDEQRKLEEQLKQARDRQRQEEIWDTYKAKDTKQVLHKFNTFIMLVFRNSGKNVPLKE